MKDVALSAELAKNGVNKDCFRNALFGGSTMTRLSEEREDWKYVEGFAVGEFPIPMHHGWLIKPDGSIVDPTPRWAEVDAKYFPAHVWDYEDALVEALKNGTLPLRDEMLLTPAGQIAYLDAAEAAMGKEGRDFIARTWAGNSER